MGASLLALAIWTVWSSTNKAEPLRLATGMKGGTQQLVGLTLAQLGKQPPNDLHLALVDTAGGLDNARKVDAREAEFGIVPNDAEGTTLRTVAPLYTESLHVVARAPTKSLAELQGKRLTTGPKGSHTERIGAWLLDTLRIEPASVHNAASHAESAALIRTGHADVAFVLSGTPAPAVEDMLADGELALVSLGPPEQVGSLLEGLEGRSPYLSRVVLPVGLYGPAPTQPVGTLGCQVLLVARDDVDEERVHSLTKMLFEQKTRLADAVPELSRLQERFDDGRLRFPFHPGAARYYQRSKPLFIREWADTISLGITVALLAWSGIAALRTRRRHNRKERVDRYYLDVQRIADELTPTCDTAQLLELRERLLAIRRQAFAELAAEKLAADESFTIFQDYLRTELLEIDAALRERRAPVS